MIGLALPLPPIAMNELWLFGLRGSGIVLAALIGVLILWKSRHWRDPALYWLLAGLSIGPIIILSWNIVYQAWVGQFIAPYDRLQFSPLTNVQFRYIYQITNQVMDLGCVLAVGIGICKLYRNVQERVRLVPPDKATTNDPRN